MNTHRIPPRTTRRLSYRLLASSLLVLAATLAPELHAQAAATESHAQAAASDASAPSELHLISRRFARATLVGSDGARYGSVGWFSSDLGTLEQHSAAAAERVRVFKRERAVGNALIAVGAAVVAGSLAQYVSGHHFGASDLVSAAYVGGGAVVMTGLIRHSIGQRSLQAALQLRNQN